MQISVKWSNNPDPVSFLGGPNELLFKECLAYACLEGAQYGLLSSPFSLPLFSPCDIRKDIPLPYWRRQDMDPCSQALRWVASYPRIH